MKYFALVFLCVYTFSLSARGSSVTSFTLINADTDQPIAGYDPIADGMTIVLSNLPTANLSVRANTSPSTVGSVNVVFDGASHYEGAAPYGLCGDTSGDYRACPAMDVVGQHTLSATPYSGTNLTGTAGSSLQISFTISSTGSSGSGRNAFGIIEAESFDEMSGISNLGTYVGYLDSGDWIKYSGVSFGSGANAVSVRLAVDNSYAGKQVEFHLDSVGGPKIGTLVVQGTGGWSNFVNQTAAISGASGTRDLYLVFSRGGGAQSDGVANIDNFQFSAGTVSATTFAVPGTIEAENFQSTNVSSSNGKGGQGAYHNLWSCTDSSGCGQLIGWIAPGEKFGYPISVASSGAYTISIREASPYSGETFHVEVDGVNVTGSMTATYTGGWDSWASVNATVNLGVGSHMLNFVADTAGYNINYIKLTSGAAPASTPPLSSSNLRVVEFNIEHGEPGIPAQVAQIASAQPDVIFLEEVSGYYDGEADQYRQLLEAATGQTWYQVYASNNYSGYADGTMILSRFSFTNSGTHSLGPNSYYDIRNMPWAQITVGGNTVTLFGVHLDWPSDTYLQMNMTELISFSSQFSGRKILGGDYNSWVYGDAAQQAVMAQIRQVYTDSFIDIYGSDSACPVTIDNGWRPDAVYHTSGVHTNSVNVTYSNLSDHDMVTVVYTLN